MFQCPRLASQVVQNVTDAIDAVSVCLLDTNSFEVTAKQRVGNTPGSFERPVSPLSGADKSWLLDELIGNLHVGVSDDVEVVHMGHPVGQLRIPETLAQGSSAETVYRFFGTQTTGLHEAIARAIQSSLVDGQRWWSSHDMEDSYLTDHFDRPAGSSRHVLLVPAWGSQGSTAVLLALAFDTMPTDRTDIEAFAKSIMIGVINRLSLRRAQTLEREDEAFLAMQPHELRTPLHHL